MDPAPFNYTPPDWASPTLPDGQVHLQIIKNHEILETHDIPRPHILLGRHPHSTIPLLHASISRSHAVLQYGHHPRGLGWYVKDLGSTYGTFLKGDGKWVRVVEWMRVLAGVGVRMGESTRILVLEYHDPEPEAGDQEPEKELELEQEQEQGNDDDDELEGTVVRRKGGRLKREDEEEQDEYYDRTRKKARVDVVHTLDTLTAERDSVLEQLKHVGDEGGEDEHVSQGEDGDELEAYMRKVDGDLKADERKRRSVLRKELEEKLAELDQLIAILK